MGADDVSDKDRPALGEGLYLQLAMEVAGFGTWEHDVETGAWTWSPQARAVLGIDEDAGPGEMPLRAAVHPADWPRVAEALRIALDAAGDGDYAVEFRLAVAAGAERWAAAKGISVKGEAVLAQYDPPWTLWFMRRNEVLLEIR